MTLLKIDNLSLAINGNPVLRDVSLSVSAGRILGLIGESGSGKSLTAFSILNLLPKGAEICGAICLNGTDLTMLSERQMCQRRGNDIAMIFQEPMTALNPLKTIGDQVAETILIHEKTSRKAAMRRAKATLDRVGLYGERFPLTRYPHELSGGQRQRVVIAMAIALRPKLLIADEPSTALDVTTQAEILSLLKQLVAEDGMGLLLITHDLAVVAEMADDIVIMQNGGVVEAGQTLDIFGNMRHPYTRALFAASGHVPNKSTKEIGEKPLLRVENVTRNYATPRKTPWGSKGIFTAVDDVSFDIKPGESLGLVGESGCGKSTLTKAILGLDAIQGGKIIFDGHHVYHGNRSVRRRMQVVFQDPYGSFNPRHRVGRLISEPFHLLDTQPVGNERALAITEALQSVGLHADDQHKFIHEFSGGQRQRIAIARALIIKPDLIILDEAVSALDVSVRAQILDLLADLSARYGVTYLFISHDLAVVRSITDRVLIMQAGKIVEQGKTAEVFQNPQNPYTKSLIAATPRLPDYHAQRKVT